MSNPPRSRLTRSRTTASTSALGIVWPPMAPMSALMTLTVTRMLSPPPLWEFIVALRVAPTDPCWGACPTRLLRDRWPSRFIPYASRSPTHHHGMGSSSAGGFTPWPRVGPTPALSTGRARGILLPRVEHASEYARHG